MNAIAIIAEFNPFHNGHRHLIKTLRQRHGSTPIVIIMSGSFVQRGEPALFDKWTRARWAILSGADLVVELPCAFALSSAEAFAAGGVRLAARLGCTGLACGIEAGTTEDLLLLAKTAATADLTPYLAKTKEAGLPYGAALSLALQDLLPEKAALLDHANALLALEYAKAREKYAPEITFDTVFRESNHDGNDCNASTIRKAIMQGDYEWCKAYVPTDLWPDLEEKIATGGYTDYKRYEDAILFQSRMLEPDQLAQLAAFTEGMENRWHDCIGQATTWPSGLAAMKTRRYAQSRLRRMAAYTVLGRKKSDMTQWLENGPAYARILAMNDNGSLVLRQAKERCGCTIITKTAKAATILTPADRTMLNLDLRATDLQHLCMTGADHRLARQDYFTSPVILPESSNQ